MQRTQHHVKRILPLSRLACVPSSRGSQIDGSHGTLGPPGDRSPPCPSVLLRPANRRAATDQTVAFSPATNYRCFHTGPLRPYFFSFLFYSSTLRSLFRFVCFFLYINAISHHLNNMAVIVFFVRSRTTPITFLRVKPGINHGYTVYIQVSGIYILP